MEAPDQVELHDIATEGSDMTRDIQIALLKNNDRPACRSMPQKEMLLYTDIGSCLRLDRCRLYFSRHNAGKASDLAKPGGFRRDHVIATHTLLEREEPPPPRVYRSFMEVVHRPNRFQSAKDDLEQTYDDFIYANFEVGMGEDDAEDTQRTPLIGTRRYVRI